MPRSAQQAATVEAEPRHEEQTEKKRKTKRQPPYAVVLHNDHVNGFDFVINALRKVFNYGQMKAFRLTLQAHQAGRSIVWSGHRELAELKADQLKSCGADPRQAHLGALPLRVTVEPLPGE